VRESETTASVAVIAQGQFVSVQYEWADQGAPQDGLLVIGRGASENSVKAVWLDSWHTNAGFMSFDGSVNERGAVSLLSSYAAPPGPDWGWRTVIEPGDGSRFKILMYNIPRGEKLVVAVVGVYSRSS
jgi:hypothetical protein